MISQHARPVVDSIKVAYPLEAVLPKYSIVELEGVVILMYAHEELGGERCVVYPIKARKERLSL
jgi:hypothetical protein